MDSSSSLEKGRTSVDDDQEKQMMLFKLKGLADRFVDEI